MLIKTLKYILLLFILTTFTACSYKSISKEELSKGAYLVNKPCYTKKEFSKCLLKSKITKLNNLEFTTYKYDENQYFKLKKGLNKITVETDIINVRYLYETSFELEASTNKKYYLKYKIDTKDNKNFKIKYQIYDENNLVQELSPKFMTRKDESSYKRDYVQTGLSSVLFVLRAALSTAIFF